MNKPEHPAEASALAHEAGLAERADHAEQAADTPAPEPTERGHGAGKKDSWLEVVKTIVYALLIAGVIRSFLFQPFNIPSGSMEDTLLIGDYLFVSKSTYGYSRYSFPFGLIPFEGRFAVMSEPKRGDIVVFKFPPDNSTDYIKRLADITPKGTEARIALTITDEYPVAQAVVIISAVTKPSQS